jgi:hypothetical protein
MVSDATQARAIVPGDLQPLQGIAWEYAVEFANLVGYHCTFPSPPLL